MILINHFSRSNLKNDKIGCDNDYHHMQYLQMILEMEMLECKKMIFIFLCQNLKIEPSNMRSYELCGSCDCNGVA